MPKEEIKVGDIVSLKPRFEDMPIKYRTCLILIVVTEIKGDVFWGVKLVGTNAPTRTGDHCLSNYTKVSPEDVRSFLSKVYTKQRTPHIEEKKPMPTAAIKVGDVVVPYSEREFMALEFKYQTLIVVTEMSSQYFCGIQLIGKDAPILTDLRDVKDYFKVSRETVRSYLSADDCHAAPKDNNMAFKYLEEFKAKTEAEIRELHRLVAELHKPATDIEDMLEVLNGVDTGDFRKTRIM